MPKLKNRPPQYKKCGKQAVCYVHGKRVFLGIYGSPDSKTAYARVLAELQTTPVFLPPTGEKDVTVKELAAGFLEHAKATLHHTNYGNYRKVVLDFLLKFYGDDTLVDNFTPRDLKLIRNELINARTKKGKPRYCRGTINANIARIVHIFNWGVGETLVAPGTVVALKAVSSLDEGHPGTFDHEERVDVPDSVIKATLPFMPPVLQAMVKLQRLTGMRPSEVFNMRAGQIDRHSDPELWIYTLPQHKTRKKTKRDKVIPLGKLEQELIAPYLEGKQPEQAVFSPRQALLERNAERQPHRKSRADYSWVEIPKYQEFYNKRSYHKAVTYAIEKANKTLPEGEKIPFWVPYSLRHSAGTAAERSGDWESAEVLLDHAPGSNATARYVHQRFEKSKNLARNRHDPFAELPKENPVPFPVAGTGVNYFSIR